MVRTRTLSKQPWTRPKKKIAERKRRLNTQKKRLADAGIPEEVSSKMNPGQIRAKLRELAKKTSKA